MGSVRKEPSLLVKHAFPFSFFRTPFIFRLCFSLFPHTFFLLLQTFSSSANLFFFCKPFLLLQAFSSSASLFFFQQAFFFFFLQTTFCSAFRFPPVSARPGARGCCCSVRRRRLGSPAREMRTAGRRDGGRARGYKHEYLSNLIFRFLWSAPYIYIYMYGLYMVSLPIYPGLVSLSRVVLSFLCFFSLSFSPSVLCFFFLPR